MKTNKLFLTFIVALNAIILINACAPAYIPNVVNAPMLNNKGETQLSIHGAVSGFDAQMAFASTDNIGLMINSSFINRTDDTSENYHKHSFVEAAVGYYTTFASDGHFEIFGGYGFGKTEIRNNNTLLHAFDYVKASYQRAFIQPNLGFSSKIIDIAFSPRLVYVMMKPENLQYTTINKFFVEPTGTFKFGFKYFFLSFQTGFSIPLSGSDDAWFNYNPFIGSFGMHIKLFRIYNPKPRY